MKKYKEFDEEPGRVNEPCASYSTAFNRRKAEVARQVMRMDNPQMVDEIQDYILQLTTRKQAEEEGRGFDSPDFKSPCQYSLEELKEHIHSSLEDYKSGRIYTIEEVLGQIPDTL